MCKGRNFKRVIGVLLTVMLVLSVSLIPLQSAFADGAQTVTRNAYYDFPESVQNYVTSGKSLEFDLNFLITSDVTCKVRLYNEHSANGYVSSQFTLLDGENGLSMTTTPLEGGWYHYVISFATIPHISGQETATASSLRVMNTFPSGAMIDNIRIATDVRSLPEAFTEDYDTVTLADLGLAGTDYKTAVSSGTYTYSGKSATKSVVIKFGWKANLTSGVDKGWKLALDTYWNEKAMVWFRGDGAFAFIPSDKPNIKFDAITSGEHQVEFGRLRVVAGKNYGKDYVFIKIDGEVKTSVYTDYYQTKDGYTAYSGKIVEPSYTVCFVDDLVSAQGFSGFAKPDEFVSDIDYVNIGDIVPGGVVKDTIHDGFLGYTYPFTSKSKTKSTVVKGVLKIGDIDATQYDGSVMVIDIGGNCGFCRSYIPAGTTTSIMFGWEIDGCSSGTKNYTFKSNSWYAVEQGRVRVIDGINKGKDYVYLKINGEIVSYFYGNPESRPMLESQIYVEATQNFQIVGYNEASVKYYVDDELYLDGFAQKGFTVNKPEDPKKANNYFVGWRTAKEGGKLFDFKNTKIDGNINLYARFTTETVKATFNPANGSVPSSVTVGKGCLFPQPATPSYSDGTYEYVFTGWKNETTGKIFNFDTDTISENTTFTAQYKEKEYYVSYYSFGKLVKKVPFVLSNSTVAGKEPAVPKIPNATGVWESHTTVGMTKSITVNAVYSAKAPSASTAIKLTTYAGGKIYLNTDKIHDYLSTDTSEQTAFVREFCATAHTYQDHQNTSFKWTDSGKNSSYTVYFADNKDFNNAYIITANKASLTNEVGIFTPGKTYYWYVCGNNTGKCSAVDSFKIVDTPVRYITAGKVTNMRDLGGRMTSDGSKVNYGLIYRGASLDEYHSHVDDTAKGVFNYLGMNSEIELRGGMQHDNTGWDENNSNAYYIEANAYQSMLSLNDSKKTQYKASFEAMANKSNYPFYFHCSAGADRTGAFAYLIYGLLGVPYEDIRADYELTSFSEVGLRPADVFTDGSFDELNRLILEQYGNGTGNLQTAVENYLMNYIGISKATLDSIKDIMLDKAAKPNDKPYTIIVDILGEKSTYQAFDGIYFMPKSPVVAGKLFKGFYNGNTKYNGYAKSDVNLTAKFEDIKYEAYDTISLKDLGVTEKNYPNPTNTVLTYNKTAKSGGRLFKFILVPTKDMNDGPQIALTNDWNFNSYARAWFQNLNMSYAYYNGVLNSGPDISKVLPLEAGKEYNIEFAVRVMTNKGYEGKKIFEVTVNGELLVQYIGCKADLSENMIYFHGGTGTAILRNIPVYKTVKLYNGSTLLGSYKVERCGLLPKVKEPSPKNGVPFAGWYTAKSGGTLWDANADLVYNDMSLYAHFANVKVITANVDGKKLTYRVEVGKTLDEIPIPQKSGHVFMGWAVNGKLFTGKVTSDMTVTAYFEAYSFDDYDEISLKDLGIYTDLAFEALGENHTRPYTYRKAATTGGRVFKAIYIPNVGMLNGPQVSFSSNWDENYFAKLYFTKPDQISVYSSGIKDGLPTARIDTNLVGGKQYPFEVGVRVLNNKGYKGVKVFTVYLDGKLIFEEFDNRASIDGDTVFIQGMPNTGIFRNVDIYKTVSFYDGNRLLSSVKVLRGKTVKSYGKLADKGDKLFKGWLTDAGREWNFSTDGVYLDTVLRAEYQKRTYPVMLMVDDVLYKRVNVYEGECLNANNIPEKAGCVFDKWLCEDGSEYDMLSPVKAPITLIARFKDAVAPEKKEDIKPAQKEEPDSDSTVYIIFGIIGIAVILLETGLIIYKKRAKK